MDSEDEFPNTLRGFVDLVRGRRRAHSSDFGTKPQVGKLRLEPNNANPGQMIYTEHILSEIPDNKRPRRDSQAILKFVGSTNIEAFKRYPKAQTTHILIQSPILRSELRTMLEDYDIDFDNEDGVEIYTPFPSLFFARQEIWNRLTQLKEKNTNMEDSKLAETYDHMKLLVDSVLSIDMAELIEVADRIRTEGTITYDLLWTLFPHKSVVISEDIAGYQQAYQVQRFEYISVRDSTGEPVVFDITCQYVHFDAYRFGFSSKTLAIGYFSGKKDVKDLDVIPLEFMPNPKELKMKLIERGKKMLQYQDVKHVQINPTQLDRSRQNYDEILIDLGRANSHGRAIVDFFTGARRKAEWRQIIKPLDDHQLLADDTAMEGKIKGKGKVVESQFSEPNQGPSSATSSTAHERSSDRIPRTEALDSRNRPNKAIQEHNKSLVELHENNSLLMCPLLHTFSLQSKEWIAVDVESVGPVNFRSNAFDHLVTDENNKARVLSIVKRHLLAFDTVPSDPIPEKGRGLLVLLSGPPGTGKTLMAESIAEKAERPLYYVDARDLGTGIGEISSKFTVIMENAKEWNAIVLLDEADIYLQARNITVDSTSSDRTTAFLRQLEYFQGILFLTTNRPETIDPAIESRIHINLRFPRLTFPFRVSIWQHFLDNAPEDIRSIGHDDISKLGEWNINGRQIKNAFRMCVSYCQQEGKKICLESLEDIIGLVCPQAKKTPPPRKPKPRHLHGSILCTECREKLQAINASNR